MACPVNDGYRFQLLGCIQLHCLSPELAEKFSIMYIPTLVLMENGTVVNKSTGFLQKEQILELLNTKN